MKIYNQSELHAYWVELRKRYLVETMLSRLGWRKPFETPDRPQDMSLLKQRACDLLTGEDSKKIFASLMRYSERPCHWFRHPYHWFDACETLSREDVISLVRTCLHPLDWNSKEIDDSFLIHARTLFSSHSAWRTPNGCLLIDEQSEDPIVELSSDASALFKATTVRDLALISYLLHSWLYPSEESSMQKISAAARNRLIGYFWEAWKLHLNTERERFYRMAFVSEVRKESCHGASYFKECQISLWENLFSVLEFDDTGLHLADEKGLSYYASPDLVANTKRLSEWTESVRKLGYPGFDGDAWTTLGIRDQLDAPLKKKLKMFGSTPDMTLREGLLRGMRELHIDQAFFGFKLITLKEYRRYIHPQEEDG